MIRLPAWIRRPLGSHHPTECGTDACALCDVPEAAGKCPRDGYQHAAECYWHGVERITAQHIRVCGECWHAFTAEELVRRHNEVVMNYWIFTGQSAPPLATSADEIHTCPLCTHDF